MKFLRVAQNLYRLTDHGTYYAVWKAQGVKHRRALKTKDRQLAARCLKEIIDRARTLNHDRARATFAELAADWRQHVLAARDIKASSRADRWYNVRAILKAWPALETVPVSAITPTDCRRWMARRKVAPQRFNNELGTLKMILQYGVDQGALLVNPAAGLERRKIPKDAPVIPTRAEVDALIDFIRKRKNAEAAWFIELLAVTGLRRNEAAELRWSHIDRKRALVLITGGADRTKNSDVRWLPLFSALRDLLNRIPELKGHDKIFSIRQCRDALGAACLGLGYEHFTHHSLRHFFCSNAIEDGVDFKTIADWLGHSDGGMLVSKTYGHLRNEHSKAMAARLTYRWRGGQVGGQKKRHRAVKLTEVVATQ